MTLNLVGIGFPRPAQIAKFMGTTWDPPGPCRSQMGPMLVPWTLLSGWLTFVLNSCLNFPNWRQISICPRSWGGGYLHPMMPWFLVFRDCFFSDGVGLIAFRLLRKVILRHSWYYYTLCRVPIYLLRSHEQLSQLNERRHHISNLFSHWLEWSSRDLWRHTMKKLSLISSPYWYDWDAESRLCVVSVMQKIHKGWYVCAYMHAYL